MIKLFCAHIIGEQVSEIIHIAFHVMLTGCPIDACINAVYNYLTVSDSYPYDAYDGLANYASWMDAKSMAF